VLREAGKTAEADAAERKATRWLKTVLDLEAQAAIGNAQGGGARIPLSNTSSCELAFGAKGRTSGILAVRNCSGIVMAERTADTALLKNFAPLDGLKASNLHALALKTPIKRLERSRFLFKAGDTEKLTFYLVSGSVELRAGDQVIEIIRSGTPEARVALAPAVPRILSVRAAEDIQYISIDSDFFDALLAWDQTGYYEALDLSASSIEGPSDWMTTLLQTKAFQRIPPTNIQAIFTRMQRIDYRAGEVVVRQGSDGDYFYIIVSGRCSVRRETPLNKEGITLAELGLGNSFGEEALITHSKRNATVTMLTEGTLMRLGAADFQTLLHEPQLQWLSYAQAKALVAKGAMWLDVRLPSELQHCRIKDALHIPLYLFRLKLGTLNPAIAYVVCCDNGRRSSAAAYILSERGFDAYVLKGGLAAQEVAPA
jgi:CRP-like cAMP-binding protein